MRRGAHDFVEKPWDNERLLTVCARRWRSGRRCAAPRAGGRARSAASGGRRLIAESARDATGARDARARRASDANVLITGENGSGKGVSTPAARALGAQGAPLRRRQHRQPAETVFESELFGHVRGAFTDAKRTASGASSSRTAARCSSTRSATSRRAAGEAAARARGRRVRAGRLSRTQQVDVRVFAATNANSKPRSRPGDSAGPAVPPQHDPDRSAAVAGARRRHRAAGAALPRAPRSATAPRVAVQRCRSIGVAALLLARQCARASHVIERAVLMTRGVTTPDRLAARPAGRRNGNGRRRKAGDARRGRARGDRAAIGRHDGNVIAAADELGMSRSALYRRMGKFGLSAAARAAVPEPRAPAIALVTVAPAWLAAAVLLWQSDEPARRCDGRCSPS